MMDDLLMANSNLELLLLLAIVIVFAPTIIDIVRGWTSKR